MVAHPNVTPASARAHAPAVMRRVQPLLDQWLEDAGLSDNALKLKLIELLHANLQFFGEAAALGTILTPIVPIIIGDEEKAVSVSVALRRQGFLVPAVRYPTVARGAAQLRATLTAAHEQENLQALAAALILARD